MSVITESDLKTQIKSKNFKNAYFIFGKEKYLVEYYTNLLTKAVLPNQNTFNLQDFSSSSELNIELLNNSIEALPLMSSYKCVRLFDFDIDKADTNTIKNLKAVLSDIPSSTIFIFSLPNLDFDEKKSAKWNSFLTFFKKSGDVLNLQLMNKFKLQKQLIKWASVMSCELSEKNAQIIIDRCGENLLTLRHELEKLCAYVNKSEITSEDIEKIVVKNLEANIFELTKVIITGNCKRAFEVLNYLLDKKEEPFTILSIIASVYIDIYRVKVAEQGRKTLNDLNNIFDYKRKMFRLENAQKYSSKISMNSLRKSLELIMLADVNLKSSRVESRIILEELIVKLSLLI